MTTTEIIAMLNEGIRDLGLVIVDENGQTVPYVITDDNFGSDFMDELQALSTDKLTYLIKGIFALNKTRAWKNLFDASQNKFRVFIEDMNVKGWTIKDYFIRLIDGITPFWSLPLDPLSVDASEEEIAKGLVRTYEQMVDVKYHYTPFKKQFPCTIDEKDYGKYFENSYTFTNFINDKIVNVSTSAEVWLYKNVLIDEVRTIVTDGDCVFKTGFEPNTTIGIKHYIEVLQTLAKDFRQPTNSYNKKGVVSITPKDMPVYYITKQSFLSRLGVYVEGGTFNLDKLAIPNAENIILIPENESLGTYTYTEGGVSVTKNVQLVMLDRRTMVIGLRTWLMSEFRIANTLKHNYWLNVEGIRSHNDFFNCVALVGDDISAFQ